MKASHASRWACSELKVCFQSLFGGLAGALGQYRRYPRFERVEMNDAWEKPIKCRLTETRDRELADDDGPIFSTVAKLVDVLSRAIPTSRDVELKTVALQLGRDLLRATKLRGGTMKTIRYAQLVSPFTWEGNSERKLST
jgi:hypothetical protein